MATFSASEPNNVTSKSSVTIVETIRDAFQGLHQLIPTDEKAQYIEQLLEAGATTIDIGSFVSPSAVPQMADTEAVWNKIRSKANSDVWALVANLKGLERALAVGGLKGVSYPLSVSEQFQLRNTKRGLAEGWTLVAQLAQQTKAAGLDFEVYLSMAFGNPYGENWKPAFTIEALDRLAGLNVTRVGLADTIGCAKPDAISFIVDQVSLMCPNTWLGLHLHGRPDSWSSNIIAALSAGCRRFDAATGSLGGCPFAQDQLVSNIPTEGLVALLESRGHKTGFDPVKLAACVATAHKIRTRYA